MKQLNPLKTKLNPICNLLALLGAHHIFHVSGLRVNISEDCTTHKREVLYLPLWGPPNFGPEHQPASFSNGSVYVDGARRTGVIVATLNRGTLLQE